MEDLKNKGNREYLDNVYSNLDHCFDTSEETVKKKPNNYFQHSAWNFCGYVWFENEKFYEEVWRYHSHIETLTSESLEDLIEETNDKYGSE